MLEARHGRVLELAMCNPALRNALTPEISAGLTAALRRAAEDDGIGAIVLRGEGEHFCAGGNLKSLAELREAGSKPALIERIAAVNELARALRATPRPVIAAVEGHAAGAGFSIALGCDLVVAAENAVFTMAYVRIGVNPDGGGTWHLAQALPPQLAAEAALTARPLEAALLARFGVVNRVVPAGRAREEALAWAAEIAAGATAAIGRTKRLLAEARTHDLSRHLERERESFAEGFFGPEGAEGLSAFLEKRKPSFHK
ncbi:MAG: enoyl-CoA hydratase family protein [Burkholderiales bacterium]|nr:enoyl-CoA hydratase family protein [Burkholderiales bacterium]